jgi:UDP-glucose 4-epimerase
VQDCIDAILFALERPQQNIHLFNLGTPEYCEVNNSIGWITGHLGLTPQLVYSGGSRGWVGDNKFIFLDTARIAALGWKPKLTIREGIIRTVDWLTQNRWVMDRVK